MAGQSGKFCHENGFPLSVCEIEFKIFGASIIGVCVPRVKGLHCNMKEELKPSEGNQMGRKEGFDKKGVLFQMVVVLSILLRLLKKT